VPARFCQPPLEDLYPGLRLGVREYGIPVTSRAQLPQSSLSWHEFWTGERQDHKATLTAIEPMR
jgi:hypothetical protein